VEREMVAAVMAAAVLAAVVTVLAAVTAVAVVAGVVTVMVEGMGRPKEEVMEEVMDRVMVEESADSAAAAAPVPRQGRRGVAVYLSALFTATAKAGPPARPVYKRDGASGLAAAPSGRDRKCGVPARTSDLLQTSVLGRNRRPQTTKVAAAAR